MPTIYEVARRAGVSTATVSRVLSRPELVAATTRRRVLRAVEHLGFTPNAAAKSLRTLRTAQILVTVPDLSNPFFSKMLQSIEDVAQREGYAVLIGDTQHDETREERYAQMLLRREADGLIFLGHRLPAALVTARRKWADQLAPIVNGCECSPSLGVPSVHIDNAGAAADAMRHLYRLGHRHIAVVTGPMTSPLNRDRLQGVHASAADAGLKKDLLVVHGDYSLESGASALTALLERRRPPTALFCFSDEMALGAMKVARQRNLRVPEELSVVGFDDLRYARFANPPLTTVAQPAREIGAQAFRLLLGILQSGAAAPSVTLPHTLVVRASTAPPLAT